MRAAARIVITAAVMLSIVAGVTYTMVVTRFDGFYHPPLAKLHVLVKHQE